MARWHFSGAVYGLGVAILLAFSSSTYAVSAQAEEAFVAGQRMYDEGVYPAAVDLFYKAISIQPEKRYYLALGYALKDFEQKALAYRAFQDAFRLISKDDADYEGVLTLLAGMSQDLGHLEDAEEYIEKLQEIRPEAGGMSKFRLLIRQADEATDQEKYARAFLKFSEALKLEPQSEAAKEGAIAALNVQIDGYSKQRKHERAVAALLRLYPLESTKINATRLKESFEKSGNSRRHRRSVEGILKAYPDLK